jgi:hypothetical protein
MRAGSVECDLNRPLPPSSFSWITKYTTFGHKTRKEKILMKKALSRYLKVLIKKKKAMNSMYKNGIVQQGH